MPGVTPYPKGALSPRQIARRVWLANRLPRWLVYWAAIRLISHATSGPYSGQVVPELSAMDALQRWDGLIEEER